MDTPSSREQIAHTPSLTESISHELTSHADKEALSAAIDAYENHYFDTNFGTSVMRYTDMMAEVDSMMRLDELTHDPTDAAIPGSANAAFFRGAMLGLHASMRFAGSRQWGKILDANFGPNVDPVENETDESFDNRVYATVLDQMDQLEQQINALDPEHKALLKTASGRLYDNDQLHRNRFESGMMYAMWTALRAASR